MIIVLKQSVPTVRYGSDWLLLHVVKYLLFPSLFERSNDFKEEDRSLVYKMHNSAYKKNKNIKTVFINEIILKKKKDAHKWNCIIAQKNP